jgi:hypothetical protein
LKFDCPNRGAFVGVNESLSCKRNAVNRQGGRASMNEPNLEVVEQARDEIIKLLGEKRHEHSLYMTRCKGINATIKDWKDKAKEAGAPRIAFKALLEHIALTDKLDGLTKDMDRLDAEAAEFLIEKLGDFAETPLGEAAVEAASSPMVKKPRKPRKTKGSLAGEGISGDVLATFVDDSVDVRPAFLRDTEGPPPAA